MPETSTIPPTDNVDPAEVAQFDRQAALWWDTNGPFRPLHQIGPTRMTYIRETVIAHFGLDDESRRPFDGLACLDVGCGGGLICEPLTRLGGRVTGIDPAPQNIGTAAAHARMSELEIGYRCARAEDLATAGDTFDVVICLEVIEHVPVPSDFVATLASLVRPGGLLILSTLNRTPKSFALAIVGAEYVLRWVPRGTHDWNRFVTPDELADNCRKAGLTDFAARGMTYHPLRESWQLSEDLAVNYLAHAVKPGT